MTRSFCILLAEDSEDDVFFLQRAFEAAQIRNPLQVVSDGQEAIDYLAGAGKFADRMKYPLPYLVLLDLHMPRRGGKEVLQWIRQHPKLHCLPVIIFSSSREPDDVERCYGLGANSFVVKPASVEQRTEFARHLKGYWMIYNEPPLNCPERPDRTPAQALKL